MRRESIDVVQDFRRQLDPGHSVPELARQWFARTLSASSGLQPWRDNLNIGPFKGKSIFLHWELMGTRSTFGSSTLACLSALKALGYEVA